MSEIPHYFPFMFGAAEEKNETDTIDQLCRFQYAMPIHESIHHLGDIVKHN